MRQVWVCASAPGGCCCTYARHPLPQPLRDAQKEYEVQPGSSLHLVAQSLSVGGVSGGRTAALVTTGRAHSEFASRTRMGSCISPGRDCSASESHAAPGTNTNVMFITRGTCSMDTAWLRTLRPKHQQHDQQRETAVMCTGRLRWSGHVPISSTAIFD
jgi:hypothetical protein